MSQATTQLDLVFFDLDDTLYSTTEFSRRARINAVQKMIDHGLQISLDEGVAELSEVVAEFSSNYPEHFARLLDRLGPEMYKGHNPAVVIAAGVVGYHTTKVTDMEVLPDVRPLLERLQQSSIRLGVISAGLQVKQAEKLIRLDVLKYFCPTAIFFSDQVGVSKPNPKIFSKACEAVGVEPTRAMYVGDRPGHDVAPASTIGMKTVHYTGARGKYHRHPAPVQADHQLSDMRDLAPILKERYHLPV